MREHDQQTDLDQKYHFRQKPFDALPAEYLLSLQHLRFMADHAHKQCIFARKALERYTIHQSKLIDADSQFAEKAALFEEIADRYYDLHIFLKNSRQKLRAEMPDADDFEGGSMQ